MISRISLIFLLTIMVFVGGCADNEMGRQSGWRLPLFKSTLRVRNPIVNKTDYWIQKEVVEEEEFPGPTPQDLKPPEGDYITGPGDRLMVRIFELMAPGQPADFDVRISEIGQVTLPYLGTIKVGGLTTRGIEEKLADLLEPDYLKDPQVTVFVLEYRNRMVTLISGVMRPGMYPLMKHDTTLLEVLAQAGGVLQGTEPYGYVVRLYKPDEADILMPGGVAKEEKPAEAIPEVEKPAEAAEKPVEAAPEVEESAEAAEEPVEAAPEAEEPAEAAEKPVEAAPEAEEPAQEVTPAEEKPAEVKEKPAEVEAEEGPAELPAQPPGGGGLSPEMIEKEIER
ncbi:MAG: polysaccharide biosynthesis/export family protein, partial [Phycisphaerae bacterium]|nr:polysaccharide biosynthesis/export family protein [Phycisphaerae bacterium]